MNHIVAVAIALFTLCALGPQAVEAQSACELYRVKKGDTLREISLAAYGNDRYRRIWEANSAEIGRNPNVIEVGLVLRLPCRDGTVPDAATVVTGKDPDAFSIVTANGYLPYTDESLTDRGLITQLVAMSIRRADPDAKAEIVFINDWSAHLEQLLPRQAFDASFPWTRPGCETQGELTPVELYACQNYLYSDPLYEVVEGYFSRKGSGFEAMLDYSDYKSKTICRPEGYSTSHLEIAGLMPPDTNLVQPAGAHRCFELLAQGRVHLVSLDTRAAERVMGDLGLAHEIAENPHLFSIEPLQMAVHKDNPNGVALLETVNRGLAIMLESGEWTSIVTEGLKPPASRLTN